MPHASPPDIRRVVCGHHLRPRRTKVLTNSWNWITGIVIFSVSAASVYMQLHVLGLPFWWFLLLTWIDLVFMAWWRTLSFARQMAKRATERTHQKEVFYLIIFKIYLFYWLNVCMFFKII